MSLYLILFFNLIFSENLFACFIYNATKALLGLPLIKEAFAQARFKEIKD
jgi:hypothetical protein